MSDECQSGKPHDGDESADHGDWIRRLTIDHVPCMLAGDLIAETLIYGAPLAVIRSVIKERLEQAKTEPAPEPLTARWSFRAREALRLAGAKPSELRQHLEQVDPFRDQMQREIVEARTVIAILLARNGGRTTITAAEWLEVDSRRPMLRRWPQGFNLEFDLELYESDGRTWGSHG